MTSNSKALRLVSALLLVVIFAQNAAIAATPGLRESIHAEIEKRYELDTPGAGPTLADRILDYGAETMKKNVVDMLTDFKMGVVEGARLAYDGNGTIVVIGAKEGWRLLRKFGKAAGINYVDSIWLLPKKAVDVGRAFGKAGRNIGETAAEGARHTADAWGETADDYVADIQEFGDTAETMNQTAGKMLGYAAQDLAAGARGGLDDAARWAKDVAEWTAGQEKDAFGDLTSGTVARVEQTGRWTAESARYWAEATKDAASSISGWGKSAWDFGYDASSRAWSATTRTGQWVFDANATAARDTARWLARNVAAPADQAGSAISSVSSWNWRRGWTQGVAEGARTGADAWKHSDQLMGTLWVMAGVGKGILHILLLEPTVVPALATYGVAGTVALSTIGFPSVGAIYAGGTAAAAAVYAGGAVATGAAIAAGGVGTVLAGGTGVARTAATAAIGAVGTAGAAVGGAALTVGAAGVNAARLIGTPVVGGVGIAAASVAAAAEIAGTSVWNLAKMAGITAVTAGGYAVLTGYEAAKMTWSTVRAAGLTVFDNAIVTPIGVVTNLAQAVASGAWTLVEDPLAGTLDLVLAGGIVVGTIVTSTGAFTYELVKDVLLGLGHGLATVYGAGAWVVGLMAKGVELAWAAINIPQHREWAAFRAQEIRDAFTEIKRTAIPDLASRFGEIILVRVHWWGEDKGRVRFFITKNPVTGERWFFGRVVDPKTCEVLYRVTNQDPLVRAFMNRPWAGTYHTGLFRR